MIDNESFERTGLKCNRHCSFSAHIPYGNYVFAAYRPVFIILIANNVHAVTVDRIINIRGLGSSVGVIDLYYRILYSVRVVIEELLIIIIIPIIAIGVFNKYL